MLLSSGSSSGQAGPYRTLINQLNSFILMQFLLYYVIGNGIDTIRAAFGPLPTLLCQFNSFTKNFCHLNFSIFFVIKGATEFAIICIYKSIPCIEDNFIATFFSMIITLLAFLITCVQLYLPGKPVMNQLICTGQYYDNWPEDEGPYNIPVYLSGACILIYLLLAGLTAFYGRKKNTIPKDVTNLGSKLIHTVFPLKTILIMAVLIKYSR